MSSFGRKLSDTTLFCNFIFGIDCFFRFNRAYRDENAKGWDVFRALVPGHSLDELAHALRSATQGIGWFSSSFDHFEELYGKEADAIVRAHGNGSS